MSRKGKEAAGGRRPVYLEDPRSPVAEAYRTLRTNLQYSAVARELKSVMVTSAGAGEGKSTTVSNLALAIAESGKRVLLVDGDLRHPTIHRVFGLSNQIGLTSWLVRGERSDEAIQEIPWTLLDVLTAGPTPPNPAELLGSERMRDLLELAKAQYDFVLIDSPPLLPVTDGQLLSSCVDGVLLVVRYGETKREHVQKARTLLRHVGANLVGAVLNGKKMDTDSYYYNG